MESSIKILAILGLALAVSRCTNAATYTPAPTTYHQTS